LLPGSRIDAFDVSEKAIAVAMRNAARYNIHIGFSKADVLDESRWDSIESYDIIVSNPPYIPDNQKEGMQRSVILREPSTALFAPADEPLLFYRKIAKLASEKLKHPGSLFLEINPDFVGELYQLMLSMGFMELSLKEDLSGKQRMMRCHLL
jgi:release factor glutamine methyltransferase